MIITQRWYSKPPFGWRVDPARNIAAGVLDHWPFNDRFGPATRSAGLQQTVAPLTGFAGWSIGPDGPALSFDGSTGYVGPFGTVDTYSFMQNTLLFTIAGRIRLNSTTARSTILCTNGGSTANKGIFFIFENAGGASGTKAIRLLVTKGTNGISVIDCKSPDSVINDTTAWHTFGVSGNGSAVSFFVDGVQVATTVIAAFVSLSSGSSFQAPILGAFSATPGLPFNGLMDWLGVWDRPLDAGEHAALAVTPWSMYPAPPWYDDMSAPVGGPSYTPWLFRPEEMS